MAKFGDTKQMKIAASYWTSQGLDQNAIAKRLGVSQSRVSRLVAAAIGDGYLRTIAEFVEDNIPAEDLAKIKGFHHPDDLERNLQGKATDLGGTPVRNVRIVEAYKTGIVGKTEAAQMAFGKSAAPHAYELVNRSRSVGVAWGGTLASVIEAAHSLRTGPPNRQQAITFFPLRGDPLGFFDARTSPSALAAELYALFNGKGNALSLGGVPAVIPESLNDPRDVAAIHKLANLVPAYKKIFNGQKALMRNVDTVLLSCGAVAEGFGTYSQEYLKTLGVRPAWLKKHVFGDIAGVFVSKRGATKAQSKKIEQEVAKKSAKWLGLTRDHLASCAKRANASGRPGVVLFAMGGKAKAKVVYHCCAELGLVNELILDERCASHLKTLADAAP